MLFFIFVYIELMIGVVIIRAFQPEHTLSLVRSVASTQVSSKITDNYNSQTCSNNNSNNNSRKSRSDSVVTDVVVTDNTMITATFEMTNISDAHVV